jgi:hypothetical protein
LFGAQASALEQGWLLCARRSANCRNARMRLYPLIDHHVAVFFPRRPDHADGRLLFRFSQGRRHPALLWRRMNLQMFPER